MPPVEVPAANRWARSLRVRGVTQTQICESDLPAPIAEEFREGGSDPCHADSEVAGPQPRDRRRWRRPAGGAPTDEKTQLRLLDLSLSTGAVRKKDDGANTVAQALAAGLCPRSKLSLTGSARLLQAPELARDFASVLEGGAHHLRGVFCEKGELKLFGKLLAEIKDSGLWRSRGQWHEWSIAPEAGQRTTGRMRGEDLQTLEKLPAHRHVLEHLAVLFNAEPLSWWINLYPQGRDMKNFHKDNFGQGITIGASFGATRDLSFRHDSCGDEFAFPQENGDVFAFREGVNRAFLHGMHPLPKSVPDPGPRISVIMMARPRS